MPIRIRRYQDRRIDKGAATQILDLRIAEDLRQQRSTDVGVPGRRQLSAVHKGFATVIRIHEARNADRIQEESALIIESDHDVLSRLSMAMESSACPPRGPSRKPRPQRGLFWHSSSSRGLRGRDHQAQRLSAPPSAPRPCRFLPVRTRSRRAISAAARAPISDMRVDAWTCALRAFKRRAARRQWRSCRADAANTRRLLRPKPDPGDPAECVSALTYPLIFCLYAKQFMSKRGREYLPRFALWQSPRKPLGKLPATYHKKEGLTSFDARPSADSTINEMAARDALVAAGRQHVMVMP